MTVKPFNSCGRIVAVTLNHSRNELHAIVCGNPDNEHKTALLESYNGDVKEVEWNEITWCRDLREDEK